jgi:hypothetical protein
MRGMTSPLRVTVAVDPFLLRSSLHAALESDSRFDAYLCPVDEEPVACAEESDSQVLVVSQPVKTTNRCVVLLSHPGDNVALSYGNVCQQLTYGGMAAFRDELAASAEALLAGNRAG